MTVLTPETDYTPPSADETIMQTRYVLKSGVVIVRSTKGDGSVSEVVL